MFNYNNIGRKISGFAKIIAIIGIVCSIIGGLYLIITGFSMMRYSVGAGFGMVFGGLLSAALGSLASWIGSWILYGFGEIITTLYSVNERLGGVNRPVQPTDPKAFINSVAPNGPQNPQAPGQQWNQQGGQGYPQQRQQPPLQYQQPNAQPPLTPSQPQQPNKPQF
ncbi:MAG: hypothetical protein LBQ95_06255 [Lachnospiraceae bacterium]|jgi:hypothetical protein|nr:hypothetical protein [Lachnospiraceae bacterium]